MYTQTATTFSRQIRHDPCLQLSGGEPTVRTDLPDIITRRFALIQLNTNGLRLAENPSYAKELADAGLDAVGHIRCLSSDAAYTTIRGQNCLAWKHKALNACLETHLAVVLLATIVKGVNDAELGALVRFAAEKDPLVRGLHLQPVAFFGRITLPELTEDIALSDFHPHPIRSAASP